jgi:putative transposase
MRKLVVAGSLKHKMADICKLSGISKSGFYKHREVLERRKIEEEATLNLIRKIRLSGIMCGAKKMKIYMKKLFDFNIGRDKLLSIMRKHDLLCCYYKQHVQTSNGRRSNYPNLLKDRDITRFGEVIVTDITYIHLPNGRFCYASVISDVLTRLILGWYVSPTLMVDGSMKALLMALKQYKLPFGAIHHSDHGVQYTSYKYTNYLILKKIQISMTGDAKCYDNAQAERIFNTLKYEYGFKECFESLKSVRQEMRLFVKSYNDVRIHESLGYQTPREAYELLRDAA